MEAREWLIPTVKFKIDRNFVINLRFLKTLYIVAPSDPVASPVIIFTPRLCLDSAAAAPRRSALEMYNDNAVSYRYSYTIGN